MNSVKGSLSSSQAFGRMIKLISRGFFIFHAGLALASMGLWGMAFQQGLLWRADFSAFYTAWAIVRSGQGAALYDMALQARFQQQVLGANSFADGLLPFNNPPHGAVIGLPLGWFSLELAYFIWSLLQIGLTVWCLRRLLQLARGWTREEKLMGAAAFLAFPPLFQTFLKGTWTLVIFVTLLEAYLALRAGKERSPGLWMALGSVKPQPLVLPGIILALSSWRRLFWAVAGMVGLAAITSLRLGWNIWPDYLRHLLGVGNIFDQYGVVVPDMVNLKGVLASVFGLSAYETTKVIAMLAFLASLGIVAWLWRKPVAPASRQFPLRFALAVNLGLILGLHTNTHDSVLLALSAWVLYDDLRPWIKARLACAALLLFGPFVFLVSSFWLSGALKNTLPTLWMAAFTAWLVWAIGWQPRKG